jgi:hypothetical protein
MHTLKKTRDLIMFGSFAKSRFGLLANLLVLAIVQFLMKMSNCTVGLDAALI